MDVIYLTDIHDAFRQLRFVLKNTTADLYILSGDLMYRAFYTDEKLYEFAELQEQFLAYAKRNGLPENSDFICDKILGYPSDYPAEMLAPAKQYRKLSAKASANMRAKYRALKAIVQKLAKAPVIFIPGNYDMNLGDTALADLDLHKKSRVINSIHFAGYGGAPVYTPGIPENISVEYREWRDAKGVLSEPLDFFNTENPHVLVVHNPAYGTLDKLPSYGHCGSFGLREYIDDKYPPLVLSGHVHEHFGLVKIGSTFCLNPSNFGGVDTIQGYDPGGFFCSFTLQAEGDAVYLRKVIHYRMLDFKITPLSEIKIDKNLRARETILDTEFHDKSGHFLL